MVIIGGQRSDKVELVGVWAHFLRIDMVDEIVSCPLVPDTVWVRACDKAGIREIRPAEWTQDDIENVHGMFGQFVNGYQGKLSRLIFSSVINVTQADHATAILFVDVIAQPQCLTFPQSAQPIGELGDDLADLAVAQFRIGFGEQSSDQTRVAMIRPI